MYGHNENIDSHYLLNAYDYDNGMLRHSNHLIQGIMSAFLSLLVLCLVPF